MYNHPINYPHSEEKIMKILKRIMSVLAVVFIGFMMNINANGEELEPEFNIDITPSLGEEAGLSLLKDSKHTTSLKFSKDDVIKVSAVGQQKISGIYVIWDSEAKPWTLKADGKNIACGQNGFIHEYIALDEAATSLEIIVPDDEMFISDIRIFSEGELPSDVQVWNPPCYNAADIMLISSHADDELLFFGGVIPVYTYIYDADIQVVYMAEFWSEEKEREHEKLNGLWAAGLDIYPVCGYFYDEYSVDIETARSQYDIEKLTGYITKVIREFKPQIIVTHDFNGEYGHGFHMLVTERTVEAVENSMKEDYYPESAKEYGVWDVKKTYIHIYKENAIKLDLSVAIDARDGKSALQLVKDGYDKHVSQHRYARFFVSDDYEYSCADFGLYRTTVGHDTGNDMLENLKTYKIQAKEEAERLERESIEQASREKESMERESLEKESLQKESMEQEIIEEASRQANSERIAREEAERQQKRITIILIVAVLFIVGGVVVIYIRKGNRDEKNS